ncbi:MAG: phosphate signaling complex protein PhoU [Chloroflexota bacterium]|nr:MAG: phosphate signaling complex protein PhoU [Chloroflexota bacterium]
MSEETPMDDQKPLASVGLAPTDRDDAGPVGPAGPAEPAEPTTQPARPTLDRDEQAIKDGVLRMGSLVEAQILAAIDALVDHDAAGAERVIIGDRRVNEAQREVTTLIARTIATQQPVARDLRFLLSLDHVAYELERIGDHAASVAKAVIKLSAEPPLKAYIDIPEMGRLGAELVRGILRALVTIDDGLARQVAARDDEIDHLYHRIFGEVVDLMRADPDNVERGTRILLASHYLERIGDRVTNIAEDVVYLASGEVEDLNP